MNPSKIALIAAGALLAIAVTASAEATTFDWTMTAPAASLGGAPLTGSGTVTANLSSGVWTVSAISGDLGGASITSLSTAAVGPFKPDNLLFPASTFLDTEGLGFTLSKGGNVVISSAYAPGSTDITPGNNYYEDSAAGFGVGTFSLAAVPEPATWTMVILGLGLIGLGMRRRADARAIVA